MHEDTITESADLALVQHQLDVMARWRSTAPFTAWEQQRYGELCASEQILLAWFSGELATAATSARDSVPGE